MSDRQLKDTPPADRPQTDVVRVPAEDPIVELQRLRAQNRRWRRSALGIGAAFVFLFVLSLIQFLGTITACKLLQEARRESARVNRETAEYLREIRNAQQRAEQLSLNNAKKDDITRAVSENAELGRALAEERLQHRDQEMRALVEQIRAEHEAMKRARAEKLPPGHEPDKNCPVKKVVDDPTKP
jgi:DNA repair exonuclease SbcCD ATPase subunit